MGYYIHEACINSHLFYTVHRQETINSNRKTKKDETEIEKDMVKQRRRNFENEEIG